MLLKKISCITINLVAKKTGYTFLYIRTKKEQTRQQIGKKERTKQEQFCKK